MQTITLALKHWASKITESLLNREAVKKSTVSNLPDPPPWKPPPIGLPLPLEFPLPSNGGGKIFSETIHFMSYTWLNKQNIYS